MRLDRKDMNPRKSSEAIGIGEISGTTGIMKERLRIWERRYGFPDPIRGDNGERQYSMKHLVRLQLVKGLLKLGYRPGNVMRLQMEELILLSSKAQAHMASSAHDRPAVFQLCLDLVKEQNRKMLRSRLQEELLSAGLINFVVRVAAPLTRMVNVGRTTGQFTVFETYLCNSVLESIMRRAISLVTRNDLTIEARPKVLLAAAPQDRSVVELQLIEAIFASEGAQCISLAVATPLKEIITRGRGQNVDIVVVSFSHKISQRSAIENIRKLQGEFGSKLQVFLDANCALSAERLIGLDQVIALQSIVHAVAKWRRLSQT